MSNSNQPVVFCDFDGTITAVETFVGMLKEFAPELSAELIPKMYAKQLSLKQGVRQLLHSIPSQNYNDAIAYVKQQPLREGLGELIDFLSTRQIPFVVVSGGLRGMVEAALSRPWKEDKQLIDGVENIFAVEIDHSGEYLQTGSQFEGETELVAKVKVMEQWPAAETIAIGDSVTDINMALAADLVFARDRLIEYLNQENRDYIVWKNFFDVRDYLAQRWGNI